MHFLAIFAVSVLLSISCAISQIISVHEVQFTESPEGASPLNGQLVEVTGLVSAYGFGSAGLQYFISDPGGGPWSGVLVFDTQPRTIAVGDSVVVRATVTESSSQTRLNSPELLSTNASTTGIAQFAAASGAIGESLEGVFISLTNPVVTEIVSGGFFVNDGTGPLRVREGFSFVYEPFD